MSAHVAAWMVVAGVIAVALTAKFFAAREKHRRARADLRASLAGIDGLAGQVRAAMNTMFRAIGGLAVVVAVLAALIYIGGHRS